ncbi:MAG: universal stress protein [Planctomycetaceae bacterium]
MQTFNNILVVTDTRLDAHPILDEAVKLARCNAATVKIVDVVPEFPWTARQYGGLRELLGSDMQARLDALASPIRGMGVEVETKVLWGKTSVEIIREVLRGQHDLVLRVAEGLDSQQKDLLGATGRRLLSDCPCAVWLIASDDIPEYKHVVGCVDISTGHELDIELNEKVYDLASAIGYQHQARTSIVHAWGMQFEQFLERRIARRDFNEMLNQRREHVEALFDEFLKSHGRNCRDPDIQLLKDDPVFAIPSFVKEQSVDLIVMGTLARSSLMGLLIGNTAERILGEINCSVLAIKADCFVSPITEIEYVDPLAAFSTM